MPYAIVTSVHVEPVDHLVHDFGRARGACHDTRAQARNISLLEVVVFECRDEHGRNAVQARAGLCFDGVEHSPGIETRVMESPLRRRVSCTRGCR